ncbi:hypothetical protein STEG23_000790, partial [Scotinomys teguina]
QGLGPRNSTSHIPGEQWKKDQDKGLTQPRMSDDIGYRTQASDMLGALVTFTIAVKRHHE